MSDSDITFESLFDGKQSVLEKKLTVDGDLLSKLQDYKIIKESQRSTVEVTAVTVCKFFNRITFIMHNWSQNFKVGHVIQVTLPCGLILHFLPNTHCITPTFKLVAQLFQTC